MASGFVDECRSEGRVSGKSECATAHADVVKETGEGEVVALIYAAPRGGVGRTLPYLLLMLG